MRRKWLADLALYLPALLIAFVIWLIAKQGDTETRMVAAPVRLVAVPDNVEARLVPTNTVEVNLIFPKTFLKNVLEPGVIRVSLRPEGIEAKAGLNGFRSISYPVLPGMVETGDLPPSVRVLGVIPENVTVEARLHAIQAQVAPKVEGTPDPGYELRSVQSSPAKVQLTGPPQSLAKLRAPSGQYVVGTSPVSVAGAKQIVSAVADLDLPSDVRPVDPQGSTRVEVTADIREKTITRIFKNVPIVYVPLRTNLKVTIQPPTTDITVKGPRSKVEALTRDSFRFVPNAVPNEAVGATNILSFRVEPLEGGLNYDLTIDADVRTVTLLFEEKNRPTPTATPASDNLLILPEEGIRPVFPASGTPAPARTALAPPVATPVASPVATVHRGDRGTSPRAATSGGKTTP